MSVFSFKQFDVDQADCAMRINTDGVLLGSVAFHNHPKRILDLGTGTGVIALMLAQRFKTAQLDAIEIDAAATRTAEKNFQESPFARRLTVQHVAFEDFSSDATYDMIVSNPPYFVNDLVNPDERKGIARHAQSDFFDHLLFRSASMLTGDGVLWLVIPPERVFQLSAYAPAAGLTLIHKTSMRSFLHTEVFREIVCFSKKERQLESRDLIIYDTAGVHASAYKKLLKDFFLLF